MTILKVRPSSERKWLAQPTLAERIIIYGAETTELIDSDSMIVFGINSFTDQ